MPLYATSDQMVSRFGENEIIALTDLTGTGEIDQARLGQYLQDASDTIDGYLASRYQLPLTIVPPMLSILCSNITRYLLETRPTDEIRARYDDAIKWLNDVAQGRITLGVDAQGDAPPSDNGPAAIRFTSSGRVFDADDLRDYRRGGGYGQVRRGPGYPV